MHDLSVDVVIGTFFKDRFICDIFSAEREYALHRFQKVAMPSDKVEWTDKPTSETSDEKPTVSTKQPVGNEVRLKSNKKTCFAPWAAYMWQISREYEFPTVKRLVHLCEIIMTLSYRMFVNRRLNQRCVPYDGLMGFKFIHDSQLLVLLCYNPIPLRLWET